MEAKQLIKDKILESARQKAADIIAAAEQACQKSSSSAETDLAAKKKAALADANAAAERLLAQGEMMANLDSRKAVLGVKRELVERVFAEALDMLFNAPDKEYADFVQKTIVKYAAAGDEVLISPSDKKRLNDKWLADTSAKCGFSLKFSGETHGGKGGVVLRSAAFDKRLTLDALVDGARDTTESAVIAKLFG